MPTKHNLMVKVIDARPADVQKALKNAGINVVSVIEIHKEDVPEPVSAKAEPQEKQ
ncbi:MAG: hypothetical protein HY801_08640 [Candidatus Lindowbacteria bacterium]|nr:hypothetical protein [Candidatus Lindowbacteria bacterium]